MNDTFALRIASLRKERRISQKVAAEALGISQALLSHYERGIRECGLDFLTRIADYYGVSADYLLCRTDVKNGGVVGGKESQGFIDLMNTVRVASDMLSEASSEEAGRNFMMLLGVDVTRMISMIAGEDSDLFKEVYPVRNAGFEAAMRFAEARLCNELADSARKGRAAITKKELKEIYPAYYSSVRALLDSANTAVRIITE